MSFNIGSDATPDAHPRRIILLGNPNVGKSALFNALTGLRATVSNYPGTTVYSLPAVTNVGPGSPTGIGFGYGAKFPAKYQESLYLCDWSYGKLYALHLEPDGSAYRGTLEEFVTGTPLPLTDVVINPKDGAMYFTTGGRKTKSGLYRVTYVGSEATAPSKPADDPQAAKARQLRRSLEAFHGRQDPKAIEAAWPHLDSPDRFIRYAARVAIEHQDVAQVPDTALTARGLVDPALPRRTRIGVVGEIYLRSHPFSNQDLVRELDLRAVAGAGQFVRGHAADARRPLHRRAPQVGRKLVLPFVGVQRRGGEHCKAGEQGLMRLFH